MEHKTKFEIVLAVLILIALAFLLWWLLLKKPATPEVNLPATTEQATPSTPTPEVTPTNDVQITTAPTIARTFVERLGSFSTESGYKNIDDVLVLATDSLQKELKSLKATALKAPAGAYYGVSTRVISLETEEESASTALISILTQRTESIADPLAKEYRYQSIDLSLVKSEDTWLVKDYTWIE